LADALIKNKIGVGVYYPKLLFEYEAYKNRTDVVISDCPNASRISKQVLSIPVHPSVRKKDRKHIVKTLRRLLVEG
jgi:dTDP-4-amino-4,6-dideoxygalactose transaminase